MANNDPTSILPSMIAVPVSICANGIQHVVSNVWEMSGKAKTAKEAAEELCEDLRDMELGKSSEQRYIDKGKAKVEELKSLAEEAENYTMKNPYGWLKRYGHSKKLTKSLHSLPDYSSQGILTVMNGIRALTSLGQKRQDASSILFSPPNCSDLIQVGMDYKVERLTKMLVESNVPWIHIAGKGGMGKSYLAQFVCGNPKVKEYFGKNILWVDCGHRGHEDPNQRLLGMQDKLFLSLTGTEGSFTTLSRGNEVMRELIVQKSSQGPYLLVLDNVLSRRVLKLFNFLGGSGSTIVTSRQRDVLEGHVDKEVVWIGELSKEKACELFCRHAFGEVAPPDEMKDYVERFVVCLKGMPLMARVLGQFMRTKTEPREWEKVLKQIEKKITTFEESEQVYEILKISYDALNDKDQKRFLILASLHHRLTVQVYICWRGLKLVSDIEEYEQAVYKLDSAGLIRLLHSTDFIPRPRSIWHKYHIDPMINELADYIIRKNNYSLRMTIFSTKEDVESFTDSSAAVSIEMCADYISSLADFSRFSNLQALTLNRLKLNMFDSDPAHIPLNIMQLKYLSITYDEPSDLQPLCNVIQHLTRLEYLKLGLARDNLYKDEVWDVGFLKNMPNLMEVDFYFGGASIDVMNSHHIQDLRKLERFSIPFFHDWDCGHLKHLKEVRVQTGTGTKIHITGTSSLLSTCQSESLGSLSLMGVVFSEVPRLHCPSLEILHLEVNMERLPRDFLQSLPSLMRLELNGGGKLTELPSFENLPKLNFLKVSDLALSQWHFTADEHPTFEKLWSLRISDCKHLDYVSAAFEVPFEVRLKGCPFQQLPDFFAGCHQLKIIDCKNLTHLPSPMMELKKLDLYGLDSLEGLVDESLPYLKRSELARMTEFKLTSFKTGKLEYWSKDWSTKLETKHLDGTEFSSSFPRLVSLEVYNCPRLFQEMSGC